MHTIFETQFWSVSHRRDSRLPGFLIIEAKGAGAEIGSLTPEALASLGQVLAKAEGLLIATFQPHRVITAKLGFSLGYSCHFHMVPISHNVLNEIQAHPSYSNEPDGNDALLFASREYCERALTSREQKEQLEIVNKLRVQELTSQISKGPSGRDSLTLAPV